MSLHIVAKHLAAQGRGPDTTLVHMTPGEVSSMQALAKANGTSMTVNPNTGLPEAGVLSSLLPTLIGAGITAATGGAAAPWMVGAGIGGLEALRTGNLGKGLMAGLGAYGGAGLTGGLADMGTGVLSQQAGAAASQGLEGVAADQAAEQAIKERLANASFFDKAKAGFSAFDWNKPMDFVSGLGSGSKGKGIAMLTGAFAPGVMAALEPNQYAPLQLANDSQRAPGLVYMGGNQYRNMTSDELAQRRAKYGYADGGLATGGMPEWNKEWNPDVPEYGNLGQDFGREILYYNPSLTKPIEAAKVTAPVLTTDTADGRDGGGGNDISGDGSGGASYTRDPNSLTGGLVGALFGGQSPAPVVDMSSYSPAAQQAAANVQAAYGTPEATGNTGGSPADAGGGADFGGFSGSDFGGADGSGSDKAKGGVVGRFAHGGIGSLGSYSDGGRLLRGPGDGVSDHIPATIGAGKQPARLADGEFVVPARIVSELGNGSTEAGARALYAMMDRIQQNRRKTVGKGKVAVNSKSTRLLPA